MCFVAAFPSTFSVLYLNCSLLLAVSLLVPLIICFMRSLIVLVCGTFAGSLPPIALSIQDPDDAMRTLATVTTGTLALSKHIRFDSFCFRRD